MRRQSLEITPSTSRNIDIDIIKFIGRQYSILINMMDHINYCFAFKVKQTVGILTKHFSFIDHFYFMLSQVNYECCIYVNVYCVRSVCFLSSSFPRKPYRTEYNDHVSFMGTAFPCRDFNGHLLCESSNQ